MSQVAVVCLQPCGAVIMSCSLSISDNLVMAKSEDLIRKAFGGIATRFCVKLFPCHNTYALVNPKHFFEYFGFIYCIRFVGSVFSSVM